MGESAGFKIGEGKERSMNTNQKSVSVEKLTRLLDLKIFTQDLDLKKHKITLSDVNRPALQLS